MAFVPPHFHCRCEGNPHFNEMLYAACPNKWPGTRGWHNHLAAINRMFVHERISAYNIADVAITQRLLKRGNNNAHYPVG